MSISYRPLLLPGVAVATAGAVALGPAVVAPVAGGPLPAVVVPSVHIEDIELAGIGQDIYYAITPYVQYAVGGVSYLINFIPLIGGPIAAQININYFQGVQPIVEATVNYLAAVVQDPFNFPAATSAYGAQLYGIGYNWVDAELQFFGLPPLVAPPAAAGRKAPARAAAGTAPTAPAVPPVRAAQSKSVAVEPVPSDGASPAVEAAIGAPAAEHGGTPAVTARRKPARMASTADPAEQTRPGSVRRGEAGRERGAARAARAGA